MDDHAGQVGEYLRVRAGIGRPPGRMDVAAFVLKDFSATERKELDWFVDRAADAVEALIADGLDRAQSAVGEEIAGFFDLGIGL